MARSAGNFYDVEDTALRLDRLQPWGLPLSRRGKTLNGLLPTLLILAARQRLEWRFKARRKSAPAFNFEKYRLIKISPTSARPAMKSGRLCEIELKCSDVPASFLVSRSEDGLHLETKKTIGERSYPGRLLRMGNLSPAQLLSREMEILGSDKIYEEAIGVTPEILQSRSGSDRIQALKTK